MTKKTTKTVKEKEGNDDTEEVEEGKDNHTKQQETKEDGSHNTIIHYASWIIRIAIHNRRGLM